MSQADIADESETAASPAADIPVSGTESMMEVLRNPEYLREWLENLDAPNLEKCRQVTGHEQAHTIGENLVYNLGMRRWPEVLRSLEQTKHPAKGEPPHSILAHPRALLDQLVHISEMDGWRLDFEEFDGLPKSRRDTFEYLVDDETTVDPEDMEAVGGTDALIHGPMGRGKTTVVQTLIARIMEINNEAVVWRGTGQRTEWLPFAPWTVVCLPEGVEYDVQLAPPEDDTGFAQEIDFEPRSIDLEDIVWKVKRYEDIEDLNHNIIQPGAFHVVFPDPLHRGAEAATEAAEESKPLEYTSPLDIEDADETPTPPRHWWFAWLIHHNAFGRSMRMTWVCDEASNLFEDHASNDDHNLSRRISAISGQYVDFRRNGLSFVLLTQKAREIAWQVRKKMRWAVTLSGTANPVNEDIIGIGKPPMTTDLTTNWPIGKGLFWTGGSYTEFDWDDIPRRLKVPGKLRVVSQEVTQT